VNIRIRSYLKNEGVEMLPSVTIKDADTVNYPEYLAAVEDLTYKLSLGEIGGFIVEAAQHD